MGIQLQIFLMSKPLPANITYEKTYNLAFIIDNSIILLKFLQKTSSHCSMVNLNILNSLDISKKETV